jgi:hypothetical protein
VRKLDELHQQCALDHEKLGGLVHGGHLITNY